MSFRSAREGVGIRQRSELDSFHSHRFRCRRDVRKAKPAQAFSKKFATLNTHIQNLIIVLLIPSRIQPSHPGTQIRSHSVSRDFGGGVEVDTVIDCVDTFDEFLNH